MSFARPRPPGNDQDLARGCGFDRFGLLLCQRHGQLFLHPLHSLWGINGADALRGYHEGLQASGDLVLRKMEFSEINGVDGTTVGIQGLADDLLIRGQPANRISKDGRLNLQDLVGFLVAQSFLANIYLI